MHLHDCHVFEEGEDKDVDWGGRFFGNMDFGVNCLLVI